MSKLDLEIRATRSFTLDCVCVLLFVCACVCMCIFMLQSLEGPATLTLHVEYNVLRAVIDFIYTDDFKVPSCIGNG